MTSAPDKFLDDLTGRYAKHYFAAIHALYVAIVDRNAPAARDAREQLAECMAATMGAAEVLGAMVTLRAAAGPMARRESMAAASRHRLLRFRDEPAQTILPRVTLSEALDDMVTRTPVTIRDAAVRTAQRIAELYSSDRVMAFVRAAEEAVTAEAHRFIARAFREGVDEGEAGRRLAMSVREIAQRTAPWSESYARMVFRTNVNTAVTAGRFRQARDPDIRAVVPAFRFTAVGDADTRPNHRAADGVVMSVQNPSWSRIAPPLGYNCRCRVETVTVFDLEANGRMHPDGTMREDRVPVTAGPDPGFRHAGRPDLMLVGS